MTQLVVIYLRDYVKHHVSWCGLKAGQDRSRNCGIVYCSLSESDNLQIRSKHNVRRKSSVRCSTHHAIINELIKHHAVVSRQPHRIVEMEYVDPSLYRP